MPLVLVGAGLDEFHKQLAARNIEVVTPPQTEPWGERFAQYRDPNGLIAQLAQWV